MNQIRESSAVKLRYSGTVSKNLGRIFRLCIPWLGELWRHEFGRHDYIEEQTMVCGVEWRRRASSVLTLPQPVCAWLTAKWPIHTWENKPHIGPLYKNPPAQNQPSPDLDTTSKGPRTIGPSEMAICLKLDEKLAKAGIRWPHSEKISQHVRQSQSKTTSGSS